MDPARRGRAEVVAVGEPEVLHGGVEVEPDALGLLDTDHALAVQAPPAGLEPRLVQPNVRPSRVARM